MRRLADYSSANKSESKVEGAFAVRASTNRDGREERIEERRKGFRQRGKGKGERGEGLEERGEGRRERGNGKSETTKVTTLKLTSKGFVVCLPAAFATVLAITSECVS